MKTSIELKILYKEETGRPFLMVEIALKEIAGGDEWNSLTITDYVEWLEEKIISIQNQMDQIITLHNYKEDYEDAMNEIGELQDKLENAEDEISELNARQ